MLGHGDETRFLWLPTYRQATSTGRVDGRAQGGMLPVSDATTAAVDRWLAANGCRMLAKPHPLSPRPPEGAYQRITVIDEDWLAERGLSLYQALPAADCLITGASTVWVDFLLADRPMICAFPDAAEYVATRGIHSTRTRSGSRDRSSPGRPSCATRWRGWRPAATRSAPRGAACSCGCTATTTHAAPAVCWTRSASSRALRAGPWLPPCAASRTRPSPRAAARPGRRSRRRRPPPTVRARRVRPSPRAPPRTPRRP